MTLNAPIPPAVPTATTGPPRARFELDAVRALGALAVVMYHGYQHDGQPLWGTAWHSLISNTVFVEIFFVVSGFLLWLPLVRTARLERSPTPGATMLRRRATSLLPLYVGVIVIVWLINNPQWPGWWQDLALHLTMTNVYSDQFIFWTDGPAWSLAVEFHFYVAVAILTFWINATVRRDAAEAVREGAGTATGRRRARSARRLVVLVPVVLLAVSVAYRLWAALVQDYPSTSYAVWFNPLAQGHDFALGMLLAVLVGWRVRLGRWARAGVIVVAAGGLAALVQLDTTASPQTVKLAQAGVSLCAAALIGTIVLSSDPAPAWLTWRPLVWVGGVSYGLYLFHEPVMRALGALHVLPEQPTRWWLVGAFVVAATLPLAWLANVLVRTRLSPRIDAAIVRHRERVAAARSDGQAPPAIVAAPSYETHFGWTE
ncbi:acyltransferase family protein [Luteimicrobium subarcticum]|uniref:Peptidoglycan/LPS O-acetylase OafA/YrhL n=1 Tax=Luteimicrobium subarcticum TaxID=620910 RepID=A0A2M8WUI4_9MICO|nr:acyltransferase [Luteimicrobium subarcticum]PJI94568.1 peptidoglycan/LPS O-acetylase OafA/YrhL [Luteimicrobium subarcticum]